MKSLSETRSYIESGAWRTPRMMLFIMTASSWISLSLWQALINNFAIERAAFTGAEIGILQSLREIPGFLAFTVVFVLLIVKEQRLALLSLCLLGIGTAITGLFPTIIGLYCTTVLMSLGFHYYETVNQSLSLQWLDKDEAPEALGRMIAIGGFASLTAYGIILFVLKLLGLDYAWVYGIGGMVTLIVTVFLWLSFPQFKASVEQRRHLVFRKRYWLFYALTLASGARRQIFVVFAGFMMVEKFGYSVEAITVLFLVNCLFNIAVAPAIGRLIHKWGERKALTLEYAGLIGVFTLYAFVQSPIVAAGLYLVDHAFFSITIAMKTYFQKIADPADIAATAGVAFTINHIAAVVIPVLLGFLWLVSPSAVFLIGTALATASLILARIVPEHPEPGKEFVWRTRKALAPAE